MEYHISKGVLGLSKEVSHKVWEYKGPTVSPHSTETFHDLHKHLQVPVMPPTLNEVCKVIEIYYILKVCSAQLSSSPVPDAIKLVTFSGEPWAWKVWRRLRNGFPNRHCHCPLSDFQHSGPRTHLWLVLLSTYVVVSIFWLLYTWGVPLQKLLMIMSKVEFTLALNSSWGRCMMAPLKTMMTSSCTDLSTYASLMKDSVSPTPIMLTLYPHPLHRWLLFLVGHQGHRSRKRTLENTLTKNLQVYSILCDCWQCTVYITDDWSVLAWKCSGAAIKIHQWKQQQTSWFEV